MQILQIIRNGETEGEKDNTWGKRENLTKEGEEQTKLLSGKIEKTDIIAGADTQCVHKTGEILFPGQPVAVRSELEGISFGTYEGKPFNEESKAYRLLSHCPQKFHRMTKGDEIQDRAEKALNAIKELMEQGKSVSVVLPEVIAAAVASIIMSDRNTVTSVTPFIAAPATVITFTRKKNGRFTLSKTISGNL